MKIKLLLVLSVAFLLFSCSLLEPKIKSSSLSSNEKMLFSRLVALGDNIISGYQSAALVEKHQKRSFVALIAQQGETPDFMQPYIGYPGLGSESYAGFGILRLKYLDNPETPQTVNPDPVIYAEAFSDYGYDPAAMAFSSEEVMYWPLPYNNLSVPGIYVDDVYKATIRLRSRSKSGLLDVILRNPLPDPYGYKTAFAQAKLFQPSLILCWAGMYDILSYAQYSAINPVEEPPTSKEDFAQYFSELMDSLKSTQAAVIVANIPDILDMPYFHSVPGVVIDTVTNTPALDDNGNPIPLVGVNEGDLILSPAKIFIKQGYGLPADFPNSNGQPLPDDVVLTPDEQAVVKDLTEGFNAAIDSICSLRNIPVVDMYGFFKEVANGLQVAGLKVTADFITGGFYSLDGVHPSDLGHVLIANEWLAAINNHFRVSVPLINVMDHLEQLQYSDSLLVR
ncbi:SGNH/GDSL hydrolase family protein [Caldithrix abyssi]